MNEVQEAKSLLESGQFEEAAEAYERLCTAQPETWGLWLNLAYCYSALENPGKREGNRLRKARFRTRSS